MALRYVIKAAGEVYKDAQGNEKTKYIEMGVVMDGKNGGFTLKLNSIPVGWNGWAFLSPPEKRQQQSGRPQQRSAPPPADDMDDDIPF